jgi:hypothetical protein
MDSSYENHPILGPLFSGNKIKHLNFNHCKFYAPNTKEEESEISNGTDRKKVPKTPIHSSLKLKLGAYMTSQESQNRDHQIRDPTGNKFLQMKTSKEKNTKLSTLKEEKKVKKTTTRKSTTMEDEEEGNEQDVPQKKVFNEDARNSIEKNQALNLEVPTSIRRRNSSRDMGEDQKMRGVQNPQSQQEIIQRNKNEFIQLSDEEDEENKGETTF